MSGVRYDPEGRVCFEGQLGLSFSSQQLLGPERDGDYLHALRSDCKKAFKLKECEDGERYSEGQTFWMGASATPRCELERLAQGIFAQHTQSAFFDPATSGAEWWTQHIDTIDDIGFHFDRDYGLEEEGELCHPHLGTVTYLSEVGGATVILDMPGRHYPTLSDGAVSCPLKKCVISRPAVGKHVTFDGLLLHGAPADLFEKESSSSSSDDDEEDEEEDEDESLQSPRVTFLVNIWLNHVPTQAVPLLDDLASDMEKPRVTGDGVIEPVKFAPYPSNSTQSITLSTKEEDLHRAQWDLQVQEEDCVIELALPLKEQLEAPFAAGALTVILDQHEGSACVRSTRVAPISTSSGSGGSSGVGVPQPRKMSGEEAPTETPSVNKKPRIS